MEIKKILESELQKLLDGETDVDKANAITKMSAQIIYKERLEVEKDINSAKIRYWDRGIKK